MPSDFRQTLAQLRSIAETERAKGALFERLCAKFFTEDPLYRDRFANVWLWGEWPNRPSGFDRADTGIDLVAEERDGGYCAIQCKCYAPDTAIGKPHLDSFISASNRKPFTSRIVVDTGSAWGPNARKTLDGLEPACSVLRFGDLAERPFDWPDLTRDDAEDLALRRATFRLRPHQQEAFDAVVAGLAARDGGKLVMACGTGKTFTALRIAERVAGAGGRVLYLVPSISLFAQSMREWASQRELPHCYVGVCSDTRAGKQDEDASLQELEIPRTRDLLAFENRCGAPSPSPTPSRPPSVSPCIGTTWSIAPRSSCRRRGNGWRCAPRRATWTASTTRSIARRASSG